VPGLAEDGIVTVTLKVPFGDVAVAGMPALEPLHVSATDERLGKFVPETLMDEPAGPFDGLRATAGFDAAIAP